MFNDRLEVQNNTMVKIQHNWHIHYHGHPQKEARIGVHSPTPHRKSNNFFILYGWSFSYFFPTRGSFWYVFLLMEGPFHHVRAFLRLFFHAGALFALIGGLLWAGVHAHYIYYNTVMLKCINIQIYKIMV